MPPSHNKIRFEYYYTALYFGIANGHSQRPFLKNAYRFFENYLGTKPGESN